jgi:hypothetical protein
MTQLIGYGLIAIIVAALLFYATVALLPEGLATAPVRDDVPDELPKDRLITREDLVAVRLPVVLRGYRMADTDDLIDRLTLEIAVRDRELQRLRADVDPETVTAEAAPDSDQPE